MTPEAMWERFVQRLAETQPLGDVDKKTRRKTVIPHVSFLGSVKSYRAVFMEANKEST